MKRLENENNAQTIIIKKVSFVAIMLEVLKESIVTISKIIFWLGICALITIGLNTLLNHQLREQIISMFQNMIGG